MEGMNLIEPLDIVKQGFDEEEWGFERFVGDVTNGFYTQLNTFYAMWRCIGVIHQDLFVFNSRFSIAVPIEKRHSMAELLVRVNKKIAFGNFNMCFDDGIVELRNAIIIDDEFSPRKATALVKRNLAMMDRWCWVILKVMLSDCTPEDAMEESTVEFSAVPEENYEECQDSIKIEPEEPNYCCSQCGAKQLISQIYTTSNNTVGICQRCFERQMMNRKCLADWQQHYSLLKADNARKRLLRSYKNKVRATVEKLVGQWIGSRRLENINEEAYRYILKHNRDRRKGWHKSFIHEYLKNNKVSVITSLSNYIEKQPIWDELHHQYIREGGVLVGEIEQLISSIGLKPITCFKPVNIESREFLEKMSAASPNALPEFPKNKVGYYLIRTMRVDCFVLGLPMFEPHSLIKLPGFYDIEKDLRKAISANLRDDLKDIPSNFSWEE